jgi:hypothetical protein
MFCSFSICCNHFTYLAYEIFYARKVDLFDKIKEVVFSQLFPCVNKQEISCTTEARSTFFWVHRLKSKILGFFHLQYGISVRQSTIMLYVRNLGLLPDDAG